MKALATVLSNNILIRGRKEDIPITPMKLQKLLYYVCVQYAKKTEELPIIERFEVWKYGPVVPSVYAEFKTFGSSPITEYAKNAKGKAKIVDEKLNPILKKCLDDVWDQLKDYSSIQLSLRTHKKGSGWYSAFQKDNEVISTEEMINDRSL